MISSTSLSAFSTPASIGPSSIGPTRPAERPHHAPGVLEARAQPKQQIPLQAQPDKPAPQPGQTLPRGSLLDLSV